MNAQHVLGWVFLMPPAVLFFLCTTYVVFMPAPRDPEDIKAMFFSWALAAAFSYVFCDVEGWL